MITTLHIKNIGIIDDLSVELNSGFNVFTGEAGLGLAITKQIIELHGGEIKVKNDDEFIEFEINLKKF